MSTIYETVSAGIPSIDGCQLVRAQKTFLSKQHVKVRIAHQLLADSGAPVDLYVLAIQEGPQTSTEDTVEIPDFYIEAWLREVISGTAIKLPVDITNGTLARVQCDLTDEAVKNQGVYLLEWRAYRDESLVKVWPSYLILEPTMGESGSMGRMPSVQDIKQALLDREPEETALSDVFTFTDDEFVEAYTSPIAFFNEIRPNICQLYNTSNFAWREHWINGIIGYLLFAASTKMTRKKLPGLSKAGVLDEYAKDGEYRSLAMQHVQQFKTWAIATKNAIAMEESWRMSYAP